MPQFLSALRSVVAAALLAPWAIAGSVPIANAGFEDPVLPDDGYTVGVIPGWDVFTTGAGVFNPTTAQFPMQAPEGSNTAYCDAGEISQTLGAVLDSGVRYTLRVTVGARLDFSYLGGMMVLSAGGVTLRSLELPTPAPGAFTTVTLRFAAAPDHPLIGAPLGVRLASYGPQVNFDLISLDTEANVPQTLQVPSQHATIQGALNAAYDGDTVLVAPGVYHERLDFGGKAINLRSSGGPAVTTIDADMLGTAVRMSGGLSDGAAPPQDSLHPSLEGFTVANGYAKFGSGGGLSSAGEFVRIVNCRFHANSADYAGGGVYIVGANAEVRNCEFTENSAGFDAGGLMIQSDFEAPGASSVVGCAFNLNQSHQVGGGANISAIALTISDCAFNGNEAGYGGGAYAISFEGGVRGCTFTNNSADIGAGLAFGLLFSIDGGVRAPGPRGFGVLPTKMTVDDCAIIANHATQGGGIAVLTGVYLQSDVSVRNCLIGANTAVEGGAGVYFQEFTGFPPDGGPVPPTPPSHLTVGGCTIVQNATDGQGGGVAHVGPIADGGFMAAPGSVRVASSILWGNTDAKGAGETAQFRHVGIDRIDRSCVMGFASLPGTGCFGTDPLFVDELGPDAMPATGDEDFGLGGGSPCVDSGDASAVSPASVTDALGAPRAVDDPGAPNTGVPGFGSAWLDIGAVERQVAPVVPCLGDENEDGVVDFFDLNNVLGGFGNPCLPGPPR